MEDEKKQYSKISKEIRKKIIDKIHFQKESLLEVAQEYQLLPSTCKSIVNTYMKEGRVGKKESRIRKFKKVVTTYNVILNPLHPYLSTVQISKNVENCQEQSQKSRQETADIQSEPQQQFQNFDISQWTSCILNQLQSLNRPQTDRKV